MRKKTWIPLLVLSILVVTGFFILQSAVPTEKKAEPKEQVICSKESTATCTPVKKSNAPGEMIMESLSRQFLSIPSLIR